jgi:hypothetical protein
MRVHISTETGSDNGISEKGLNKQHYFGGIELIDDEQNHVMMNPMK